MVSADIAFDGTSQTKIGYEGYMVSGYRLSYVLHPGWPTSKFYRLLFGRVNSTYKEQQNYVYSYYYPGHLHNIRFKRMRRGVIYIEDYPPGLLKQLRPLCKSLQLHEVEFTKFGLKTGRQYWEEKCRLIGFDVKLGDTPENQRMKWQLNGLSEAREVEERDGQLQSVG